MKCRIEYDGNYPNLCSGHLKVFLDDVEWDFGKFCLNSGGSVLSDNNLDMWTTQGEWSIDEWPDDFPVELRPFVLEHINAEIEHGCCGGCI